MNSGATGGSARDIDPKSRLANGHRHQLREKMKNDFGFEAIF
jgi:hypothetical protein